MPDDPNILAESFEHLGNAIRFARDGFGLWRDIKDAKVPPERAGDVERIFQNAEHEQQLAEAAIGKAFGYQLCRCTLPPQVCLKTGYDRETGLEKSRCAACGTEYPEPEPEGPVNFSPGFD